jgi:hypothetical protein
VNAAPLSIASTLKADIAKKETVIATHTRLMTITGIRKPIFKYRLFSFFSRLSRSKLASLHAHTRTS